MIWWPKSLAFFRNCFNDGLHKQGVCLAMFQRCRHADNYSMFGKKT